MARSAWYFSVDCLEKVEYELVADDIYRKRVSWVASLTDGPRSQFQDPEGVACVTVKATSKVGAEEAIIQAIDRYMVERMSRDTEYEHKKFLAETKKSR
jgi:hypothetical protein